MADKVTIAIAIIVVLVIVGFTLSFLVAPAAGKYDDFAQCISDAGAQFYGAWWCPHCENQRALFLNSAKLPYIECSNSDRSQNAVCNAAGIQSYPTWVFSDGSRLSGELSFQQLAAKTNCPLPE